MIKRFLFILALLCAVVQGAWATDVVLSGGDGYTAQDGDVLTGSTSGTVTIMHGAKVTLSDVTITGGIVCEGTAEITLEGTNSVTGPSGKAGIQVGGEGTTLTIKGDGSLTATGGQFGAGIGTGSISDGNVSLGNITINGGTVTATGGYDSPGIGTGYTINGSNASLGNIIINGGAVTATGGYDGAGIGTGYTANGGSATLGNITINGGTVTATGSQNGAGIGTGYTYGGSASLGNITINGGTVTATGGIYGAGIGTGYTAYGGSATLGNITIYDTIDWVDASSIGKDVTYMHDDTDVTANATDYFNITIDGSHYIIGQKDDTDYTITIDSGIEYGTVTGAETGKYIEKITMTATPDAHCSFIRLIVKDGQNNEVAVDGTSFYMPRGNVTVSAEFKYGIWLSGSDSYTVQDGDELFGSTSGTVTIADGAKITLSDVNITGGIVCEGTAEITLVGTNSVTGPDSKAGILVGGEGTTLTIKGDGSLTATGGQFGAGIGTGYTPSDGSVSLGNIIINGGTVTVTGGYNGAGIGTGRTFNNGSASLGNITINGGTVTATGGDCGPGIGTGCTPHGNVSLGNIVIEGGTITATGGKFGAGIGTGETINGSSVSFGNIIINGGTVTATGGYDGAGIGTGLNDDSNVSLGNIVIEGGTITATGGDDGAGIGTGYELGANVTIGSINIYCDYDFHMLDASSFSKDVTYMYGDTDVTANATDYFIITTEGGRNIIKCLYTAQDGDVLTGSTDGTLTIADGARITLNDVTINSGIICAGTAEITLVGTNSVTGPSGKAGIQVGGTGTTLTIKGDGSLAATGGEGAAGIGLSSVDSDCTGGNIVIEGGTITATGGQLAAGIGTCFANNVNVELGDITFKGGTVTAIGGSNGGAGIGTGVSFFGGSGSIGAVTVYVGMDRLDASSISKDITYKYCEDNVTANASDFFDITVDADHHVVETKKNVILADGTAYRWIYGQKIPSATYHKTLGEERVGKHQAWFVPFDYTITSDDEDVFTFYKINMIANSPDPSQEATDDIWVFLKKLNAGDVLHGNMPYVYKPKQTVTDYEFTTLNATLMAKANDARITMMTAEDTYTVYGTYENTTATPEDPFYYVNINGALSLGNDGSLTVGPYRWIMRVENKFGGSPAYARDVHFFDAEDDMTGISSMDDERWTTDNKAVDIYNLAGQRLNVMQKGINIVNGKKVLK